MITSRSGTGGAIQMLVRVHEERAVLTDASDWRGNMSTTAAAQLNNNEEQGLNGKPPSIFLQWKRGMDPNVALNLLSVRFILLWSLLCNIYCLTSLNGWNFLLALRGGVKGREIKMAS